MNGAGLSPADAAQAASLFEAALLYRRLGFSVLPLDGKKATVSWQRFQSRHATADEIQAWWNTGRIQNIGIVCGTISRLAAIDLDGQAAIAAFESAFPSLCATSVVHTGSGQGKHIYLRPRVMPRTTRLLGIEGGGNIELRSDGCYVVAPPSIHPDTGQPYTVEHPLSILEVEDLSDVTDWLLSLQPDRRQAAVSNVPRPPTDQRAIGFGQAALHDESRAVAQAAEGSRNNCLNRAAYNLGQLVGDNILTRWDVEQALLAAALAAGLDEKSSWRTIQSGLKAGMNNPRSRRYGR